MARTNTNTSGGGGGTIGGSIAASEIVYGLGTDTITGDNNHTIDPTTGFSTFGANFGGGESVFTNVNDNILGFGVHGTSTVYTNPSTTALGVIILGNASVPFGGDDGIFSQFGVNDPSGNVQSSFQGNYDSTTDTSQIILHTIDSSGDEAQIKLIASPSQQRISFNFPSGGYKFPNTNGTGQLTNDGSGNLTWTPGGSGVTGSGIPGAFAYWTSLSNISNFDIANISWNDSTLEFQAGNVSGAGTYIDVNAFSGGNDIVLNIADSSSILFNDGNSNGMAYMTAGGAGTTHIVLGDPFATGNNTRWDINDGNHGIVGTFVSQLSLQDVAGNQYFSVWIQNGEYELGDINQVQNGALIEIQALGPQTINVYAQEFNAGDIRNTGNSTKYGIDDSNSNHVFQAANGILAIDNGGNNYWTFDPNSGVFKYGLFNGGNFTNLVMDDSGGQLAFQSGGNNIIIAGLDNTQIGDINGASQGVYICIAQSTGINFNSVSGSYTFPTTNASGALTNDGSGNLTWVANGATVYPISQIVFGDGSTAGGVTNADFIFIPEAAPGIPNATFIVGDNTSNTTSFAMVNTTFTMRADNGLIVTDGSSGNTFLNIDPSNHIAEMGDISLNGNQTILLVDDGPGLVSVSANTGLSVSNTSGSRVLVGNSSNFYFAGGDVDSIGNETAIIIDDTAQLTQLGGPGSFLQIDSSGRISQIGDVAGINNKTVFIVSDASETINAQADGGFIVQDTSGLNNQWLNISPANFISRIGDVNASHNGTLTTVDDSTQTITSVANNFIVNNPTGSVTYLSIQSTVPVVTIGDGSTISALQLSPNLAQIHIPATSGLFSVTDTGNTSLISVETSSTTNNGTLLDINDNTKVISLTNAVATVPQYATPTTGSTVTSNSSTQLILNPAGALLALTIVLPPSPIDGQQFWITTTQVITGVTFTGGTVVGNPAGLGIGGNQYVFSTTVSKWILN